MKRYLLILATLNFCACSSNPPCEPNVSHNGKTKAEQFSNEMKLPPPSDWTINLNSENMLKIKIGMSSGEILKIFGPPRNISKQVCGALNRWTCTTWEYGDIIEDWATFTFSGEKKMILNDFQIKRK